VSASDKEQIEVVAKELEELIKGDDKDAIEAKTRQLAELSGKLAQQAYSAAGGESGGPQAGPEAGPGTSEAGGDDVVDAEFEEVKDDDKK